MKRTFATIAALLVLGLFPAMPAVAGHNADSHTDNLRFTANFDADGEYRAGTDIAFWGDTAVLGNYTLPGGFRILDISDPSSPEQLGQFVCPGRQADVSVWEDLVVMSVDDPMAGPDCDAGTALQSSVVAGTHWEGLRIVSIANPAEPVYLTAVDTDCGSHTNTLLPDPANDRLLVYVLSYPIAGQGVECNAVSHGKISIVEIPLDDPASASVVATPSVAPAIGCHDVTMFTGEQLAAAACITETQIWDISDPIAPRTIGRIRDPLVNIHHSTTFSWDGDILVIGDEMGAAIAATGCLTGGNLPLGALWFWDVSDPTSPVKRGSFVQPRNQVQILCTAHNFNVIPMLERDILVSGWYHGGTTVIDFTDPTNPTEIAHYTASSGGNSVTWSSYWYNGYIWVNNFDADVQSATAPSRGFDVLYLDEASIQASARSLPFLNAQVQDPLPEPKASGGGGSKVKGRRQVLPSTGASTWYPAALTLLAGAAGMSRVLRRRT